MRQIFIVSLACIALQLAMPASARTYLCGASGVVVKSSSPCKLPKTDLSIQPIATEKIDIDVLNKTMASYRVASRKKDILALERLIADDFLFESYKGSWNGKRIFQADKKIFLGLAREHLLAMTSYQQIVHRFAVIPVQKLLVAETLSTEKVTIGEKKFEARILERVLLDIINGEAKIRIIKQIEY